MIPNVFISYITQNNFLVTSEVTALIVINKWLPTSIIKEVVGKEVRTSFTVDSWSEDSKKQYVIYVLYVSG